jgi:hypothetical protein
MDPRLFERVLEVSQTHPMPLRFPPIGQTLSWISFVDRAINHHQRVYNAASHFGPSVLGRNAVRQSASTTLNQLQNMRERFFHEYKAQKLTEALNGQNQFLSHHSRRELATFMRSPSTRNVTNPNIIKYWQRLEKVYNMNLERLESTLPRFRHLINYWQNVKTRTPEISGEANQMLAHYRQLLSEVEQRRNTEARRRAGKKILNRNVTGRRV